MQKIRHITVIHVCIWVFLGLNVYNCTFSTVIGLLIGVTWLYVDKWLYIENEVEKRFTIINSRCDTIESKVQECNAQIAFRR